MLRWTKQVHILKLISICFVGRTLLCTNDKTRLTLNRSGKFDAFYGIEAKFGSPSRQAPSSEEFVFMLDSCTTNPHKEVYFIASLPMVLYFERKTKGWCPQALLQFEPEICPS